MMQNTTLYRYYDVNDSLLYVGISLNAINRLAQHASNGANWVSRIARSTFEHFNTREEALQAEKSAIKKEKPSFNVIHNTQKKERSPVYKPHVVYCDEITVFVPVEKCYAKSGQLISFETGNIAKVSWQQEIIKLGQVLNYTYVCEWMEHFGYFYEDGYIYSDDRNFCANYRACLLSVDANWRTEFIN